jgi:hypothetical protein
MVEEMKVNVIVVNTLIADRNKNVLAWRAYLKSMDIENGYEKMELLIDIWGEDQDEGFIRDLLSDLMVTGAPCQIEGCSRESVIDEMTDKGFYPNSLCGHYALYEHPGYKEMDEERGDWFQDIMCDNEHGCEGCNIVAMTKELVEADWDKHELKFTEEQLSVMKR